MKKILFVLSLTVSAMFLSSCDRDDELVSPDFEEVAAPTDEDDNNGSGTKGGNGGG